uniref:7TM GPCR serpentine receptor class x (Srx) domain-containing protein n=1 Tax=Plectus sambesii TaxID=2011161 RepID=A0A914WC69_9BILA
MAYSIVQFFGEDIVYLAMMLAIPAHLLVVATFHKYRKTTFAASYFALSCSVLLSDAFMCATNVVFNLLIRTPMGPGIIMNGTETIILWDQTLYSTFSIIFRNVNQWALLTIAVNRFIFVSFPSRATNIWTTPVTVVSVIGQWGIGLLFGAIWRPSMRLVRDPTTGMEGVAPNVDEGQFWSAIIGVSNTGTIVVIFSLYIAMFCTVRAHKKRMSDALGKNEGSQQNTNNADIKLAIQAVIFSLFLIPQVLMSVLMLIMPPPPMDRPMTEMPVPKTVTYITNHVTNANYYSTSFVMLMMSKSIREHVRKFIGGTAAEAIRTDNRTSSIIRNNQLTRGAVVKMK